MRTAEWISLSRALLVLLALALPAVAAAQEADVLTGRVIDADGKPVAGARVEVMSAETEITRSVITDRNGRYMLLFPDGGGNYLLRVTFIGMSELVQAIVREGEEELLLTNITLSPSAIPLTGIDVRARRPAPSDGQAGEQSTFLPQELLNRLPLSDLDPNTLALLSAGVVATSLDSLSGQMGFSIAGMSDLLNQITLDGVMLGQGGMGVPEEGVRRTQVTTSTFDVSRGGFAGGLVSMTSARGNNRTSGALSYRLDEDALQVQTSPTTNAYTRHNVGGSIGGPIVRNRLFYNTSFQLTRNVNHRFALAADDPVSAQRSGVDVDSITRFLAILDSGYGLATDGQTGAYDQLADDLRLQARVDWNAVQKPSQSQTLSARFNVNLNDQDSTRISSLDLAQHGGDQERNNHLAAVTLNSRFGTSWINALSLSFSESWNEALPFIELPEGQVRVTSDFDDGTRGTRNLVFGGNRNMPTEAYNRDLQLSNDLSLLLPVGSQLHRLKVGASIQKSREVSRSTNNLFGTFTFNSLDDFESNRPDRYERALTELDSRSGVVNNAIYLGDTWRVSQPLEITAGVRWDRSRLDQQPAYNPAVEAAFGRRTDVVPEAAGLSPRIGFNYRLNRQGQPARSLSGGIGMFAGRPQTNIISNATRQTGLPDAEQRLICIGAAVPISDWDLYLEDPTSIPTTCADGGAGPPDAQSSRAPTVTLIDPDQSLPSSLRVDLGYRTSLPLNLLGNFRYTYARGIGLWGYRDINLDDTRMLMLGNENRPFFGDASAIVPETGAVSMSTSRVHSEFGTVQEMTSDRASASHQLTMQMRGMISSRLMFGGNYTLGFTRDQGSGSFALSSPTAGSPNTVEWGTSSNDRRHTMNLTLSYALRPEIEITAIGRLSSGTPFTPVVNQDINGDGMRNDRAYVFDSEAAADTAIANAMNRLMNTVPGNVRSCLRDQVGRIAERNSCRNGWTQSVDMRLNVRPNLPGLERRLTMSLDARNVLTGLDQLIYGADDMKGWGEGQRADANLLEVHGFDPATNSFLYEVNEGFGQTKRGPNAFSNGFSITLSGRVAIGGQALRNNRAFGAMPVGMLGGAGPGGGFGAPAGGRGGFGDMPGFGGSGGDLAGFIRGSMNGVSLDTLLASALVNPVEGILALRDTIGLSAQQVEQLKLISDTLQERLEERRSTLSRLLQNMDMGAFARMRGEGGAVPMLVQQTQLEVQPQLEGARRDAEEALGLVRPALTDQQWQKLPDSLRSGQREPGARRSFNAIGLIDRMLANPLPVLLELKDTLSLTPEQVTQLQKISGALQETLDRRRTDLGKRFDNLQAREQARVFQEVQPEIGAARRKVQDALKQVERILTKEQWSRVPETIRNPSQGGMRRPG